jgi:hypothetical protein
MEKCEELVVKIFAKSKQIAYRCKDGEKATNNYLKILLNYCTVRCYL